MDSFDKFLALFAVLNLILLFENNLVDRCDKSGRLCSDGSGRLFSLNATERLGPWKRLPWGMTHIEVFENVPKPVLLERGTD